MSLLTPLSDKISPSLSNAAPPTALSWERNVCVNVDEFDIDLMACLPHFQVDGLGVHD